MIELHKAVSDTVFNIKAGDTFGIDTTITTPELNGFYLTSQGLIEWTDTTPSDVVILGALTTVWPKPRAQRRHDA
jgi:hypothetical protein